MTGDFSLEMFCDPGSLTQASMRGLFGLLEHCGFRAINPQFGEVRGIDTSGSGTVAFSRLEAGVEWIAAHGGLLTLWGAGGRSIDVSVAGRGEPLSDPGSATEEEVRFEVVTISGQLRVLEEPDEMIVRLWRGIPEVCAAVDARFGVVVSEDMLEAQWERWCIREALSSGGLPPVAGFVICVPVSEAAMVEALRAGGGIAGCSVVEVGSRVCLFASALPLDMPDTRWRELQRWAIAHGHRCRR